MSPEAKQARSEYMKKYRKIYNEENREKIYEARRNWAKKNPDKIREYQERFWEKKYMEMQILKG